MSSRSVIASGDIKKPTICKLSLSNSVSSKENPVTHSLEDSESSSNKESGELTLKGRATSTGKRFEE